MFFQMTYIFYTVPSNSLHITPVRGRRNSVAEKTSKPVKNEDPVIWTVPDGAQYLRISQAKVYRLIKEQRLPVVRIGKTWRFRKDLLDVWLSECVQSSVKTDGK